MVLFFVLLEKLERLRLRAHSLLIADFRNTTISKIDHVSVGIVVESMTIPVPYMGIEKAGPSFFSVFCDFDVAMMPPFLYTIPYHTTEEPYENCWTLVLSPRKAGECSEGLDAFNFFREIIQSHAHSDRKF